MVSGEEEQRPGQIIVLLNNGRRYAECTRSRADEISEVREIRGIRRHRMFHSRAVASFSESPREKCVMGFNDPLNSSSMFGSATILLPIAPSTARTRGGSLRAKRATRAKEIRLDRKRSLTRAITFSGVVSGIQRRSRNASSTARSSALALRTAAAGRRISLILGPAEAKRTFRLTAKVVVGETCVVRPRRLYAACPVGLQAIPRRVRTAAATLGGAGLVVPNRVTRGT